MKRLLPAIEAGNSVLRKIEPIMNPLSERLVDFVLRADPRIFDEPPVKRSNNGEDVRRHSRR
jgi:hypothetical protein